MSFLLTDPVRQGARGRSATGNGKNAPPHQKSPRQTAKCAGDG
jgi:hypothetical protein